MPELIEAGYVYIAKPPLYRVKNGSQEIYVEKESELEAFLLRDKLEKFELADADGKTPKLTAARWQRFNRKLQGVRGLVESLQAEYGHEPVASSPSRRSSTPAPRRSPAVNKLIEAEDPEDEPFETELRRRDGEELRSRRSTAAAAWPAPTRSRGAVQVDRVPQLVEVHADLLKQVGQPPFKVTLGERPRRPSRSPSCAGRCSSSRTTGSRCSASRASAR